MGALEPPYAAQELNDGKATHAYKLPNYFAGKTVHCFSSGGKLWMHCLDDQCVYDVEAVSERMRGADR